MQETVYIVLFTEDYDSGTVLIGKPFSTLAAAIAFAKAHKEDSRGDQWSYQCYQSINAGEFTELKEDFRELIV